MSFKYLNRIIFSQDLAIKEVLKRFNETAIHTEHSGFGIIINGDNKCIGVVSEGDIRRKLLENISLDEYQKRWNMQMGKLMKYSKRGIRWGGLMFKSQDILVNASFNPLTKPIIWRAITCRPMFGLY